MVYKWMVDHISSIEFVDYTSHALNLFVCFRNTTSGNPVAGVPVLGGITGGIGKLFG